MLACLFGLFFLAGTVLFSVLAGGVPAAYRGFDAATAAVCAVFTIVVLVDLAVIRRRMSEQLPRPHSRPHQRTTPLEADSSKEGV